MRTTILLLAAIVWLPFQIFASGQGNDTTVCDGQSVILTAPSGGAGAGYSWSQGAGTSQSVTVMPNTTSVYVVTVTPAFGPHVLDTFTVTVTPFPVVTVSLDHICQGDTGTITASVSVPGGTFSWSPGGFTTPTINVTPASSTTYTVTYNYPGCSAAYCSSTITVYPPIFVTAEADTGHCVSLIIANGSGGFSPYQYDVNGGAYQNSDTFSNLPAGNYVVTVIDQHDCTATSQVTLGQTSALVLTLSADSVTCNGGSNGAVIAHLTGGNTPYQYAINGGAYQASSTFSGLAAGNYTVGVQDSHGCTSSASITVKQPVAISLAFDTINVTCSGASTGAIIVTPSNGTAPYQYAVNGGANQLSDTFSNLAPGSYTISAQDANGCTAAASVPIIQTFVLTYSYNTVNTGCNGATTGAIVVNVAAGTPPFQYSLDSGAFQPVDSFVDLALGTYSVQVKDGNGCTLQTNGISIVQATQVSLSLSSDSTLCFGSNDGIIIATATSGTPPYEYNLSDGSAQSNDSFPDLAAGLYTVNVLDVNRCSASSTVQVYQPGQLTVAILPTGVSCPGRQDGSFTDSASGGTAPYSFSATSDGAIFHYSSGGLISNLDTGTYTVIVADNNGCVATGTGYIPNAQVDSFSVISDSTSCYGPQYTDGGIQVTSLSNTNVPYQFSLDSGQYQYSPGFMNLAPGTYNITVKNSQGCITQIPAVGVFEATPGALAVYPADTILQLGQSIQLTSVFGPFPPDSIVSYSWTPSLGVSCTYCSNPSVSPYSDQNTYTLTVTYNSQCTVSADVIISTQNKQMVFIPDAFTPNGDGNDDVFLVYGSSIKTVNLKIVNRWGEMVFQSNNQFAGWDGTYKGSLEQPGVYTYEAVVTFLDDSQITKGGSVTLLR